MSPLVLVCIGVVVAIVAVVAFVAVAPLMRNRPPR
jgi:hypothetical protein